MTADTSAGDATIGPTMPRVVYAYIYLKLYKFIHGYAALLEE